MRIGISTSVIQRGKTGVAEYVFSLTRAFLPHADRHAFHLFVLEEDLPLFAFVAGAMKIVPVAEKHRPAARDIWWHQTVLPRLAKELRLDVLHVPSYRRLVWRKPCATVGTIHDLAPFHLAEKYDWKRMWYGRVAARYLARRQDGLIAVSETTARDMARFWKIGPERTRVVHHGIQGARFSGADEIVAKQHCADRHRLDQPFFLYLARLEHPAKNHVRLIQAFERFKAATHSPWLLVFGGSDWHGAGAIHAAIQNSPNRPDIRSLGFVADEELPLLYRAAAVFVYPSLYEGFGFPPLQAMAARCPVLCSKRGALAEIAGDATLELDPEDVDGMAASLAKASSDPALREELRRRGTAHAAKFDWGRAARETLAVYAEAVRKHGARRAAAGKFEMDGNPADFWKAEPKP